MKNRIWIMALVAALAVVAAAAGCLLGSAVKIAGSETLYGAQSRLFAKAYYELADEEALSAFIGLTENEQADYARQAAAYMAMAREGEAFNPTVGGKAVLNEKERAHMQDVRGLVRGAAGASKFCVYLAAALAVVAVWLGQGAKNSGKIASFGALFGVGLVAMASGALSMLSGGEGFTKLFYGFHRVFFSNDFWLMDVQTDALIRMMPEPLFAWAADQAVRLALPAFGVTLAMLAATYALVGGIVSRHVKASED